MQCEFITLVFLTLDRGSNNHAMSSPIEITARINEIEQSLKILSKDVKTDTTARKHLQTVVRQQVTILESPLESIWRMMMEVKYIDWNDRPGLKLTIYYQATSKCQFENSHENRID